jgi:hypothetical protein
MATACWSECVVCGQPVLPFGGRRPSGRQHAKRKFQYGPGVVQLAPGFAVS